MKKVWFIEQKRITGFSVLIFDKHVLGLRNHQGEQNFANWKKPFNSTRWFFPPLITPFMRHLGTLFTHCWQLSHHCFSCYPYPSLQHLSPGGNTQNSCICKGCQCRLLANCLKLKGPSPSLLLGCFELLLQNPASLTHQVLSTLILNTWVLLGPCRVHAEHLWLFLVVKPPSH